MSSNQLVVVTIILVALFFFSVGQSIGPWMNEALITPKQETVKCPKKIPQATVTQPT